MNTRPATTAEVRAHYRDQGNFCHIDCEGRVRWHPDATLTWLEGRWVSEYRVADDGTVFLQ